MRRLLVLAFALTLAAGAADARPGLGGSFGSRGSRTFLPPARTATTPFGAAPLGTMRPTFARPAPRFAGPAGFGLNRGRFATGFLGGLLGAGLFGLLVGHGLFAGMHGLAGAIGLLLQLALICLVVRWLVRTWAGGPAARPAMAGGVVFGAPPPAGGARPMGGGTTARPANLALSPADYRAFEAILLEVQRAWTRGDVAALGRVTTPQVAATFGGQLAELGRRGVRNATSNVRFDGGDLAESWRENMSTFATVAMRYSMIDVTTDASGRLVDGSPTERVSAREYWTFVRAAMGGWKLSAIQQA